MSTTTDDETTVTIEGNGQSAGPFPLNELDQHGDDIARAAGINERLGEARDRLRQLSFDVGGHQPDRSSIKVSIDLLIPRELRKGSEIRLVLFDSHGELLTESTGKVVGVTFEDEYKDGFIVATERVHKVKTSI